MEFADISNICFLFFYLYKGMFVFSGLFQCSLTDNDAYFFVKLVLKQNKFVLMDLE